MPDTTLYLFDGYNLLHAGPFDQSSELVDVLASFVALQGARGIVVFDGVGEDTERGPLSVRYAPHADALLERLAATRREEDAVTLVTSDLTVAAAAGAVARISSQRFFREHRSVAHREERPGGLVDRLDPETAARLERLRRGE